MYAIILLLVVIGGAVAVVAAVRHARILTVDAPQAGWLTKYDYAHRGLHSEDAPENSLPAFKRAVEAGYAIELDVRLTLDGQVVVFHDSCLLRMTGAFGKVRYTTLARLQKLRLAGTGEHIPTLREVLELVAGRVPILIELKNMGFAGRLERRFYEEVKGYEGEFAVQSFSPWSLRWFRQNAPHIPRGQLACDIRFCGESMHTWKMNFLRLVLLWLKHMELNYLCRPNFISYEYHDVGKKVLRRLRQKGALVLAWTVRDEAQMATLREHTDAVIFEGIRPA